MFRPAFAVAGLLALTACQSTPLPDPQIEPFPLPADEMNACGAAQMQDLVGQPTSVIAAMTFAAPMRLIGPDMAVTMDFSPERLNITHDAADIITGVTCG